MPDYSQMTLAELATEVRRYKLSGRRMPAPLYVMFGVEFTKRLGSQFEQEAPEVAALWGEDPDDRWYRLRLVEDAAWRWWLDYAEHPSWTNLRSRVAEEFGYSEAEAAELIAESINDSGAHGFLHAIPRRSDALARHRFLPEHVHDEPFNWNDPDDYVFAVDRRLHPLLTARMMMGRVQRVMAERDRRQAS